MNLSPLSATLDNNSNNNDNSNTIQPCMDQRIVKPSPSASHSERPEQLEAIELRLLLAEQQSTTAANSVAAAYLVLLGLLTVAPEMPMRSLRETLANVCRRGTIVVVVDRISHVLCGAGTVFVEQKLIHCGGTVAHIEDIVVHERYRRRGVGSMVLGTLEKIANESGSYKAILNCTADNANFYGRAGFKNKGVVQMSKYF